jgi:hypothetical protein
MPEQMFAGIENFDRVNGLLHDLWFAASRICLQGRDLVIPFASKDVSRASRASPREDARPTGGPISGGPARLHDYGA